VTHHHADHTQGIGELIRHHKCRVIAPRHESKPIAHVTETVDEGDTVRIGGLEGHVIATPGHTAGHISYFFPADKLAFVGDTLFSIGCGRVIEGDPEMMWRSLVKLRDLPDDTEFFCGHEYTDANIRFAKTIEPGNKALNARADEVATLLAAGKATIPATIGAEKAANPFLRADDAAVAQSVGLSGAPAWQVFAEIRERKNRF
jgi:hydroxyacylglutathione hydrolase